MGEEGMRRSPLIGPDKPCPYAEESRARAKGLNGAQNRRRGRGARRSPDQLIRNRSRGILDSDLHVRAPSGVAHVTDEGRINCMYCFFRA